MIIMNDDELESLVNEGVATLNNLAVPQIDNNVDTNSENAQTRFSTAPWFDKVQNLSINIIGVGGIGSWAAINISRLAPLRIVLYDSDVIELSNIAGQFYTKNSIGEYKSITLQDLINQFNDSSSQINSHIQNLYSFTSDSIADITVCGLDNMTSRKILFDSWLSKTKDNSTELFIDGRLTANELQVFCIMRNDITSITKYRDEYLFSSNEALPTLCSFKQTTYMASMIGSIITNLIVNYTTNLTKPLYDRILPFFTYYNSDFMLLKTE